MLPTDKYKEIVSYNNYKDICRSILGIALVKAYLDYYEFKTASKLKYTDGKPEICGIGFEFNISHSGNWVTCTFDKNKIGVDIEKIFNEEEKSTLKVS